MRRAVLVIAGAMLLVVAGGVYFALRGGVPPPPPKLQRGAVVPAGERWTVGRLELVGRARIDFTAFAIEPPSVAGLVTVRSNGILEFRLIARPA